MRNIYLSLLFGVLATGLSGCRGCIAQHDPRADWKRFEAESSQANQPEPILEEDGSLPPVEVAEEESASADPISQKYQMLCASCHGIEGKGDGAAGQSLTPKPRDFVTWNDATITDEYIAKVIREGGVSVGKSPLMAAWGGVLTEEEIIAMVEKIRSFRNK